MARTSLPAEALSQSPLDAANHSSVFLLARTYSWLHVTANAQLLCRVQDQVSQSSSEISEAMPPPSASAWQMGSVPHTVEYCTVQ